MAVPFTRGSVRELVFGKPDDKGLLVVVFLRGGADTLNLVAPYSDDRYHRLRPTLALSEKSVLRIDDHYGFHPELAPLLPIFEDGRLGIVNGVGSDNPTGSHFECQDQIEHGASFSQSQHVSGGWLGRYLQWRSRQDGPGAISAVAIGKTLPESLRGAPSSAVLDKVSDLAMKVPSGEPGNPTDALRRLYANEPGALGRQGGETLKLLERLAPLREDAAAEKTSSGAYPEDSFGQGLREVARLAKADLGLEVATIDLDGWDSHFVQAAVFSGKAAALGKGLAAFDADIAAIRDRVTVVVMTEFGRRLYENSSLGTDHGRGFAMLAMGRGVAGGRIHGPWPIFEEEEEDVATKIRADGLQVRYSYRTVLSEILGSSAGLSPADRLEVFPDAPDEEASGIGLL